MTLNQVQGRSIGGAVGSTRQTEHEGRGVANLAQDHPQDRYQPSNDDRAFGLTMVGLAATPLFGGFVLGLAAGAGGSSRGGGKLGAILGISAISNLIGSGLLLSNSLGTSLNTAGLALLGLPAAAMASLVYQKLHQGDGPS